MRYYHFCNALCLWSVRAIPTYRVYRLYDLYNTRHMTSHVTMFTHGSGLDMSTDQDELYESLQAFIGYAESAIEHNGDINNLDDLVEQIIEQVYQFSILLGDVIGEEGITIFRDLVSTHDN